MKVQAEAEHEARLAAERLGLPFLVYRDGEGRQRIHPLERGRRSVTIGRRDEADISLPWDPECSRLHAELELRAGEWTISDDGLSQNGTWVNELRLIGRRRLADGDDVRVGRTHVIFANPGAIQLIDALIAVPVAIDEEGQPQALGREPSLVLRLGLGLHLTSRRCSARRRRCSRRTRRYRSPARWRRPRSRACGGS